MSKKIKVSIALLIFISFILNVRISYGYKKIDMFTAIPNEARCSIEEYGIKTRFKTYKNGQELYNYFITEIAKEYKTYNEKISKDNSNFLIEFKDENAKGHIEFNGSGEEKNVSLQIVQKSKENNLLNLKERVEKLINTVTEERIHYWIYLKAKLNDEDGIRCINEKMISSLRNKGVMNISTVEIENGYSSSAYTRQYEAIKNGDNLTDFNFAVCKYSSGNYIIIGTPEIFIPY